MSILIVPSKDNLSYIEPETYNESINTSIYQDNK